MTTPLIQMSRDQLLTLRQSLEREYELVAANRLALDLSRGKPAAEQVALSNAMEDVIDDNYLTADGTDTRNYGGLRGIAEARDLGAELLGVPASHVIAGGNSSLFLMHLCVSTALRRGLWGDTRKWAGSDTVKILTPVPGYDRHFALTEALGIEMVNVAMTEHGPDMAQIQQLAAADASIKGIWCVPKYANPTGCTYSDETVKAMAALPRETAADDFLVLWDNAYAVHDLSDPGDQLASVFAAAEAAGTSNHVVQFASTSKITFAGAGVAFVASGEQVLSALEHELGLMMIGPDKVNQLRHARFLGGRLRQHMRAHAAIIKPKFDAVQDILQAELGGLGVAQWTKPVGGYFVSLDVMPGLAEEVVRMAKAVGLTLTPAGATYPYGADPDDSNVRIAPTFAGLDDLRTAMQILTLCVKLAATRKLLKTDE